MLVAQYSRLGDKKLLQNASEINDWIKMKKIAAGDYTYKLKEPTHFYEFLPDEGVDNDN